MSASPFPPKGYCINLDRRPDRWQEFCNQTADPQTLNFFSRTERFEAIDGANAAPKLATTEAGAFGCAVSHVRALSKLASTSDNPNEIVMVVEDDILITNFPLLRHFIDILPKLQDNPEWLIFLLTTSSGAFVPYDSELTSKGVRRIVGAMSGSGYLVRVRDIPQLISTFDQSAKELYSGKTRRTSALDVKWLPLQKLRPFLCFTVPLATQRVGHSDIEQRVVDYSPLFKRTKPLLRPSPTTPQTPSHPCSAVPARSAPGRPAQTPRPSGLLHPRRPPRPPPGQSLSSPR
jgi:hypothetical protein